MHQLGKKERRLSWYPRPERIIRLVWHTRRRSDTFANPTSQSYANPHSHTAFTNTFTNANTLINDHTLTNAYTLTDPYSSSPS